MQNSPESSCCVAPDTDPGRTALLRKAVGLELFSVGYNILEGIVAVGAGWLAGSIALVGFGFDSTIETISAVVVFLRLFQEFRGHDPNAHVMTERRAEQIVGVTLFALCGYVLFQSGATLIQKEPPSESLVGIVLASLSILIMPFLAAAKKRTGRALGSRALTADASETLICVYLSLTLLLGLGLNALFGWWWADPLAALVMVPFILREAREAWEGEIC